MKKFFKLVVAFICMAQFISLFPHSAVFALSAETIVNLEFDATMEN